MDIEKLQAHVTRLKQVGGGSTLMPVDDVQQLINRVVIAENELSLLPAKWSEDSSLCSWFPLTADEIGELRAELIGLRQQLTATDISWQNAKEELQKAREQEPLFYARKDMSDAVIAEGHNKRLEQVQQSYCVPLYAAPVPAMPTNGDAESAFEYYLGSLGGAESKAWHDAPVDGVFKAGFAAGELAMPIQHDSSQAVHIQAITKAVEFIENGIELGYIIMPDAGSKDSAHETLPLLKSALEAMPMPKQEPIENPHEWIIEKLSYHKFERDDLSIDDCMKYLSKGWSEIHARNERQFVLQILSLLANQQPSQVAAMPEGLPSLEQQLEFVTAERDGIRKHRNQLLEKLGNHPHWVEISSPEDMPDDTEHVLWDGCDFRIDFADTEVDYGSTFFSNGTEATHYLAGLNPPLSAVPKPTEKGGDAT